MKRETGAMTSDFIKRVQDYVAEVALGTSALRNQGESGVIQCCPQIPEEN
jgi:hypothetical protein